MPALFTFLFKVNIALVLFCLGYYLVLRHLTFYTLNRIYLVTAILFSSIYPWINLDSFMERHQQLAAPVQTVILQWRAPAENLVKPLNQPNYWQWAEVVFWAGAALLAIRLATQLVSLYRLYRNSEPGKVHNYAVRLIDGDVSPFSFWRSIYVNPDKLSPSDLEKVLEHEHVHVSEWHTLDILLAELSTIFYWFNPGIWLMKKAVRENVEFITDRKILQKGVDTKQYQYSLLTVSLSGTPNNLVNNFNISTIKKRIIMMNAKRSSRLNLSRYMFVAPAVIILLLVFNISKAGIAKKGLNTIKSITSAIKGVTISNDDRPIMHPASSQPARVITAVAKTKTMDNAADTVYAGKSKNGKKSFFMTSDASPDSINYIINGVKGTRADLKAIDPAIIYSLDLMPAKDAKKIFPELPNNNMTLFATTDDSETGRALKEKIDRTMRSGKLAGSKNISIGGSRDSAPVAVDSDAPVSVTISPDSAPVAVSSGTSVSTTVSSDEAPEAAATGSGSNMVYITAAPKIATSVVTLDKKNMVLTYSPKVRLNMDKVYLDTVKVKTFKFKPGNMKLKPMVYAYNVTGDEATIDGPDGAIFIVDGKEVKSIKNINSNDIKSISILKNETAEKRYGKKAKNGVVVITTKKGSK